MARSIKLPDDIVVAAETQSVLHSRSLGGQITHWAKIGKAIEQSSAFSQARISAVLSGKAPTTTLSPAEYAVWSDRFDEMMGETTPEAEAFFAERRKLGLGSGLDENGKLVEAAELLAKHDS